MIWSIPNAGYKPALHIVEWPCGLAPNYSGYASPAGFVGRTGPFFAEATKGRLPAVPGLRRSIFPPITNHPITNNLSPLFRAASSAGGIFCTASFGEGVFRLPTDFRHRECGAELGGRDSLGVGLGEEGQGAILGANPDFVGPGFKVELLFLRQFGLTVGWGTDLDADFRGHLEGDLAGDGSEALVGIPPDIGRAHTSDGGDGAFRKGPPTEKGAEQERDVTLSLAVASGSWWRHEKGSVGVGLDSVWQIGEGGIPQHLLPPPSVESDHLVSRGKINEEFHWWMLHDEGEEGKEGWIWDLGSGIWDLGTP
jgi:hypothetical protein